MAETPPVRVTHLTSDEVAAYLDVRCPGHDRRHIDPHLAECDSCRAEVLEVRAMLKSAPRDRRSNIPVVAKVGAVAAAILLVVLPLRDRRRSSVDPEGGRVTERAVLPDAGHDSVVIVAPALDAAVAPGSVTIVWRRGDGDAQFRVELLNERGDIRWSTTTRDSIVSVPDSVSLSPASTYVVYVDALRADGTSVRSAPRTFTVGR